MKKLTIVFLLLFTSILAAQTTAVTATIVDSDSSVWSTASWSVQFVPNSSFPNINQYTLAGQNIATYQPYYSLLSQTGVTNGSGVLSVTLLDNLAIQPSGSAWRFTVKSNTSGSATVYIPTQVNGSTYSLSSYLSSYAVPPRFPAIQGAYGYADVELITVPNPGGLYYNTTNLISRQWTGATWVNLAGGGGGGIPYPGTTGIAYYNGTVWGTSYTAGVAANNLVQLNGSALLPALNASLLTNLNAAAVTGTLTNNTTGNANTATSATAATAATNLNGSNIFSIPYQSNTATTSYVTAPTIADVYFFGWQPAGSAVAPNKFSMTAEFASPPPLGATTPNAATVTQITINGSGNPTIALGSLGGEIWQTAAPTTGCGSTYGNGFIWHNNAGTAAGVNRFYICDAATTTWNAKF